MVEITGVDLWFWFSITGSGRLSSMVDYFGFFGQNSPNREGTEVGRLVYL
jgi:hypothetical protein